MSRPSEPRLVGVIHLPPLPGSPRFEGRMAAVVAAVAQDARVLSAAGFEGIMVENFGDVPFTSGRVEPVTVAAMTTCALAVRDASEAALGINVLRNDAASALGIAAAVGAALIRINVHTGARLTDQGFIEGDAYETLRLRAALGLAGDVALWCDVAVKHSVAIGERPLGEEAAETVGRGLADAVLLTGSGTGVALGDDPISEVRQAVGKETPVIAASGVTPEQLRRWAARQDRAPDGVIIGSYLRADGRAGGPIDPARAEAIAAWWAQVKR